MSTWPTAVDYRDALQHPGLAFKDPVLQAGKIEVNKLGVPRARSGAFANVYKLTSGSRTIAARVFLYPEKEREGRYHAITDHLSSQRPSSIVSFNYSAEGIRVNGGWFPLVTMDWVSGVSLGNWVRDRVYARETDALLQMAERWGKLLEDLRTANIAHGDLQHDNVMVVGNEPVLVDYDCMCVPALVGRQQLENGKPAYQHPLRKQQPLTLQLDNFSAWIVLIALRALAIDLSLWERYVDATGNEALLFTEADLTNPDTSPLWSELLACPDAEVQDWARHLRATLPESAFDAIPRFSINPFAPLEQACEARPRDWAAIVQLAGALTQRGRAIPTHLQPVISEGQQRQAAQEDLLQAVQSGDARRIAAAYKPALLDDWAACAPLLDAAREAVSVVPLLEEMEGALRSPGDGRRVVQLWDQNSYRLRSVPGATRLGQQAESWRARIRAAEEMAEAVARSASEHEIAAAWEKLENVGGHPDAAGQRDRAAQARGRAEALNKLRAIPDDNREDHDRRWLQAWDEQLLGDSAEGPALKARARAIEERLQLLKDLRGTIERVDRMAEKESAVLEAAAKLRNYRHQYLARIKTANERVRAIQALTQALSAKPLREAALAEAWQKLDAATATRVAKSNAQVPPRCELAVKRRDCLNKLQTINPHLPLDEQDAEWLATWDEPLLKTCADAAGLRPRCDEAAKRTRAWLALEKALRERNLDGVGKLAADPLLIGYPPLERSRALLDVMLAQGRQLEVVRLLLAGQIELTGEHLRFVRENPEVVGPYRGEIATLLLGWLTKAGKLQGSTPAWVLGPGPNSALVRWAWPYFDRVTHCLVVTHPDRFLQAPDEVGGDAGRIDATEFRRAMGGFRIGLPPAGRGRVFVTIWPVIDVGWTDLVGQPLHVGPIAAGVRPGPVRPGPAASGRRP